MIFEVLAQMREQNILRSLDFQFARLIARDSPCLALAAALLSQETAVGHVCLPLSQLDVSVLAQRFPAFVQPLTQLFSRMSLADWQWQLLAEEAVSTGEQATPLVLAHQRLYFQRLWQDEGDVATFFARASPPLKVDERQLASILRQLFPESQKRVAVNWQQVAVAVAVTHRVAVISGGPGTGKTTTVAKLLTALIRLYPQRKWRIQLAAPTGKAAARLSGSLVEALETLALTPEELRDFPQEAYTLHRLLGVQPDSQRLRYHRDNPLHLDLLVVDEASMVDLSMMARLIAALPSDARLILLGDRDQLASVEAGAVLGDLCRFAEAGFRVQRARQLSELCGAIIPEGSVKPNILVRDSVCLLKKSYRFATNSGIGQLAMAVNAGDVVKAINCFNGHFADVAWYQMAQDEDYQQMIAWCLAEYRNMLQQAHRGGSPAEVLDHFNRFRLLCALREGPFGQQGLNGCIEQALIRIGLIDNALFSRSSWYPGRPIMVTRNDVTQKLFNGDIGITMNDHEGRLRVYFRLPDGHIKGVQPNRLAYTETAYAMTVHKSQGSEFEHTILVLPTDYSPIVSRELLYTAITRAKRRLTLFSQEQVMISAIHTPTLRHSGLSERLLSFS